MSPAGVEPATYRLGGGRVHSFFTPYKRKLCGLTLSYVLFSYFKCLVVFGKVMGKFPPLTLKTISITGKMQGFWEFPERSLL